MKRTPLILLASMLVFSLSIPCQAGELHKGWTTAKKTASKELKKAKLKKLNNYVKFDKDLGPNLDKLEKLAEKDPKKLSLKTILKDKKLTKAFGKYSKTAYIEENYLYLTKGYKMKPQKLFTEYIKPGSKYELNIDSKEKDKWMECNKSGNWKPCDALRKTTYNTIFNLVQNDRLGPFQKWLKENPKENPYAVDPEPLKKEILAAVKDYTAQVNKMDKKAKAAKEVLLDELKTINSKVKKM